MSLEVARFECDECGERFLSQLALRGHQSVHREAICFACQRPGADTRGIDGEVYHADCAQEYGKGVEA